MAYVLRALNQAPNRRPLHPARIAGTTLPPLLRVWGAEVTGVPAKLARHEVHLLLRPKRADRATTDARQNYLPADVSEEARNQQPRSQESSSTEGILSAREVINLLRRCRYDRSRRIPIARLAAASGVSPQTLYVAMNSEEVSEQTCIALTPILREIAAGRLEFRRRARRWEEIEYPEPGNRLSLPQPRIVPAADYSERARCGSCGSQRFSPFMADKLYFACGGCVGETDRRMLGACYPVEAQSRSRAIRARPKPVR
jgi:hypothetical protein